MDRPPAPSGFTRLLRVLALGAVAVPAWAAPEGAKA